MKTKIYNLEFFCEEKILTGGRAQVRAKSLKEAKEKLKTVIYCDNVDEDVEAYFSSDPEYCGNTYKVNKIVLDKNNTIKE